ncbi:potassium-transporting ATPase subunit KdpC [Marinitenerispora sediminis]|uniref:Potassium-transporting ATPase KdpC subunit n=1 Tax=Marinitenerispora sediminis TaxID=1931232 RepID=A0A368T3J2_9ACTN|nr:potassium-transporting ATPase subunit KdpC [Marinitenerispora sediminis]RCV55857.1 potassium-transporting ATPase subunit C [Marinitenerispora sediminis]RCV56570.1 potassium-transporting ATPase subunit C [Marinitenerispora sediminis]RCV59408.1 potassium-transporting ATPase subunit C [Marinitenerispora sediminis]
MGPLPQWLRPYGAAVRFLIVMTVLLGVGYPLAVTGVAQVLLPHQANGSLVRDDGRVVGSALIGQDFAGPEWFHPRPSAAGEDGYDGAASGASNLGPNSPELRALVEERRAAVAAENGVPESAVPPDAVTASGSGLDPHVSPAYAAIQVDRVAQARGLSPAAVRALVAEHTTGRALGVLGEPGVNVLELNLALEQAR